MRLISEHDVERLIDPQATIAAVADGYRRQALGHEHGRLDLRREDPKGSVLVLAGHAHDGLFAAKTNVHVYPDPQARRRLAQSLMMLWDSVACEPLALISTTAFNNHRTAAGLAAAAQVLAPAKAKTLAIFGAGKIAPAAIRYLAAVCAFERIYILGHGPARARELAETVGRWPALTQCQVTAETDPEKAVRDADVIVTLTTSSVPVFPGHAVKPGALVILAGANRPEAREADDALIARAHIYLDHREGCLTRAGDIAIPLASGHLKPGQIAGEIGARLAGEIATPPPQADIVVFKSMGVIGQDIAIAALLLARAQAENAGTDYDPQSGVCRAPALAEAAS